MERVWVSPLPHIVTTAQGACTFEKKDVLVLAPGHYYSHPTASAQALALSPNC